ncbi:MAG: hypothetical protein ACI8Y8_003868, partial [Planctomycetota bacterium]
RSAQSSTFTLRGVAFGLLPKLSPRPHPGYTSLRGAHVSGSSTSVAVYVERGELSFSFSPSSVTRGSPSANSNAGLHQAPVQTAIHARFTSPR